MHIAYLTPEYSHDARPDGGLGNYLRKTGLALSRQGHQVSIFCLSRANREWQDGDVRVHEVRDFRPPHQLTRFRSISSFLPAFAQLQSARRLERVVWKVYRDHLPDILHVSSYKTPGYSLRGSRHLPLVCRVSSYTPFLRSACGLKRGFGDYLCDWLEIRQVLDAQASFAPSEFLANAFARLEGYRPEVIRTLPELEEISLDPSFYREHLKGDAYLLYFGTLNRIKGVDLLAPVASEILPKHPRLKLVFIGRDDGLPGGRKAFDLVTQANEAFKERLFYHPALPKSELYPVIANALGVLMPSRVDNLPNACLEAQALGVPVVGTLDSSLEEMISEGETGFLARNDDWESLCAAAERLLGQTPSARARMCERIVANVARAKAEDRVGQLVEFYHTTIATWQKGRSQRLMIAGNRETPAWRAPVAPR